MKKLTISSLLLIISLLVIAQDFEVAPVQLFFNAEPGESQSKIITIKNHGNKKTSYLLSIEDFLVEKTGRKKYLPSSSTKSSISKWISISPAFIDINPNESGQITVTLQAPIDDYSTKWGSIFINVAREQVDFTPDNALRAGMNVSGRVAVEVQHSPNSNQNFRVIINNLKEITTEQDSNRIFEANIDNIGEKVTECKVYLIASNLATAEETQLNPMIVNMYPKASRKVKLTLPDKILPSGQYALAAILDYGSSAALEGTQIVIEVP